MTHPTFTTVLLDWDGCMAQTLNVWLDVYQRIYTREGVTATPAEILAHSWGNLVEGPKYFKIKNPDKVWKDIVDAVEVGVKTVKLYPTVKQTIKKLKKVGKKLAIVTSSEKKLVEPALKFHELDGCIDFLITEKDVKKPKPDPEMIFLALKKLKSTPEETLIIGDSSKDILSGKNAGIITTLMLHPENKQFYDFDVLKKLKATYMISIFSDLLDCV